MTDRPTAAAESRTLVLFENENYKTVFENENYVGSVIIRSCRIFLFRKIKMSKLGEIQLKVDNAKNELAKLQEAREELEKDILFLQSRNTKTWLVVSTVASILAVLLLAVVCTSVGLGLKQKVNMLKSTASNAADAATATASYFGVGAATAAAAALGYQSLMS